MSNQIPVEVYESVAKMCQQNLLKAITEGDTEQMAKSLSRMTHALQEIETYKLNQAREGKL